jgi:hypothetical protein
VTSGIAGWLRGQNIGPTTTFADPRPPRRDVAYAARMDELLKLAADAGVEVSAAEGAVEEGAHGLAREALDRADDAFAELRTRWPATSPAERAVIAPAASAVKRRRDAVAARIPAVRPLADGIAELDPEQEHDPEQALSSG